MTTTDVRERNKAAVLRFKKLQGTKDEHLIEKQVLAPGYQRTRVGMMNLAANAQGHGYPSTGSYLRAAIPDRVDVYEQIIAEGDRVGLLWKLTGTQKGPLYGHAATNRRIDIPEIGVADFVNGKWQEGWYFGDELGMMLQLGALHMLGTGKA